MATADGAAVPHRLEVDLTEEESELLARLQILLSADSEEVVVTALEVLASIAENQALGGTSYLARGIWRRKVWLHREGAAHDEVETEEQE